MVSTRGVKFKFSEGEKVLCYEPDPTKAKVLYDSKVLEVIVKKDTRGRKTVEYLIHFQGWNSSWDRCVGEDYVLKDTDDNRRLQRTLSDKAQLQLRERKQQARRRKTSDRTSDGAEEGVAVVVKKKRRRRRRGGGGGGRGVEEEEEEEESSGVDEEEEEEDDNEEGEEEGEEEEGSGKVGGVVEEEVGGEGGFSFGEDEEEDNEDEAKVPLSLSDNFKKLLEEDEDLITCKNKLVRLPATPNVVSILEGFTKQYALNQLFPATMSPEKRKKQPRSQHHHHRHSNGRGSSRPRDFNKALRSLNLCKEVVDGIRIYFDHTLSGLLLYEQEKEQYEDDVASLASLSNSFRIEARNSSNKGTPTKVPIKQEHDHSVSNSPEDFFTVLVKEEPRTVDSDRELSESNQEVFLKTPMQEGTYIQRERPCEERRRFKEGLQDCRDGHFKYIRHENPCDSKTEGSHAPGAFHNAMSSAASTSSCCSTPSCLTPSNHPSSMIHDRTSMGHSASENALLTRIMNWKMIPDGVMHAPSQLYGATHLARLFVKLPDLLHASGMHEKKLKVLLGYLHSFLEYLEEHTDWFGEAHYKDNPLASL